MEYLRTHGWKDKLYAPNELYHSVGIPRALDIFDTDSIPGIWEHNLLLRDKKISGSCLTRNKALCAILSKRSPIQLIMDRDIIRHHNKLVPVNAELQYKQNFQSDTKIRDYKYYSRSNKNHPNWDEEFVIGDIKKLNLCLKGIVFTHDPYDTFLKPYEVDTLYEKTREYAKKHDIPLCVSKDYFRSKQERLIHHIWDRLEEMEEEQTSHFHP